jgi:hypothetical protein
MAAFALLALAGCSPMYLYGKTGKSEATAKPAGCHFPLIDRAPDRPFDELGILAPEDIEFGRYADTPKEFADQVRPFVCAAGGDAVVAETNRWGRYIRGVVIRYR